MGLASDNPYPSMLYVEGTTPASPSAGRQRLFVRSSDHVLCMVNSSGTVTALSGSLTNPMTTGGDIIYGGASGVPTRLANGAAGQLLQSAGSTSAPTWGSRILRGAINADGTIAVGTGFTSSKTATGRYTVTFTVAFSAQPVVVLTAYAATSSQHGFLFSVPTTTAFDVETTNFAGSDTDKAFNFIAMEA